ncbi:Six-hairpin glycosidase-like protein [Podospora appendiculata]|uniref:Six-hairpin glycosidase-like protein n=1 Tax=Podospora appendiculata TaxID=314037 RepID=A0AAE0X5J9_9PEZI|nr:Six-hairpin glycosidase-like protein [Podospora appendiculata]
MFLCLIHTLFSLSCPMRHHCRPWWATPLFVAVVVSALGNSVSDDPIVYEPLPNVTLFPGPWDEYIKAPKNKSHILPARFWKVRGNVSTSTSATASWGKNEEDSAGHVRGSGIVLGPGGVLTVEFKENYGGRVCFDIESVGHNPVIHLAYSESPLFAGPVPDATTDRQERDLPLPFELGDRTGTVCVGSEYVRGAFKYLTISLPYRSSDASGDSDSTSAGESQGASLFSWDTLDYMGQKILGHDKRPLSSYLSKSRRQYYSPAWVSIASLWVNCTAFPSQTNGRAYSGYFYSSSSLLNRIWYAGAWTLQLSTLDPKEGSALIDYNRLVDHNNSPVGSWYSNFTIANGTAVTTDGAKRDRVVWPGDMFIAIPGIAVSTYDMVAVRNALDVLYDHQYADGSLPYAGPPMGWHGEFSDTYHLHTLLGTYAYVLYSGDVGWLRTRWPAYLEALKVSIAKVDHLGLLHVSSVADWLRPGMTGHNLEASAMLHTAVSKSIILATWLANPNTTAPDHRSWTALQHTLENGLARLYCPSTGLFSDNVGARSCTGTSHLDPQDGNSWALISGLDLRASRRPWTDPKSPTRANTTLPTGPPTARNISANLRARWTRYGAPAVEFPNVISPFASGFELLAHCAAADVAAAVELILLEWGHLLDGRGFTNSTLAEGFRVDGNVQYPAYWSAARNSHAHGWASGPTGVLTAGVLGIELVAPGGAEWAVHPDLTPWLGWARGGFATARGRFEVKVWRVVEAGEEGGRKGVAMEVLTPEGTKGTVGFGGEVVREVDGGRVRRWVAWDVFAESGEGKVVLEDLAGWSVRPSASSLDAPQEKWYELVLVSKSDGTVLVFDDQFAPPVMQERPVGVVDWSEMEKHFKTPPPERCRMESLRNL